LEILWKRRLLHGSTEWWCCECASWELSYRVAQEAVAAARGSPEVR
jgi:hypothetical protein